MSDENKNGERKEGVKAAEQQLSFLQRVGILGYNMADQVGKMEVINRPEKDVRSYGFADLNGRKQIVLSAKKEDWKRWFEDALKELSKA